MQTIPLPYGTTTLDLHIDEKYLEALVEAPMGALEPDPSEEELIACALRAPIGTPPLAELARGKKRVVIVTSDHTRAVPSKLTLPHLLAEVRRGNPQADITILIATNTNIRNRWTITNKFLHFLKFHLLCTPSGLR